MGGNSAVYVHQDQLPDSASRNRQIALSVPAIGGVHVYANSVRPFRQVHIKNTGTYVHTLDGIITLTVNSPTLSFLKKLQGKAQQAKYSAKFAPLHKVNYLRLKSEASVDEKDNPPQPSSSLYIAAGKGNTADRSRYQPYGHH